MKPCTHHCASASSWVLVAHASNVLTTSSGQCGEPDLTKQKLCFYDELSHFKARLASEILLLDWHRIVAFFHSLTLLLIGAAISFFSATIRNCTPERIEKTSAYVSTFWVFSVVFTFFCCSPHSLPAFLSSLMNEKYISWV